MIGYLVADIGGTTSRFARYSSDDGGLQSLSAPFTFATTDSQINSFDGLLAFYRNNKPESFPLPEEIEHIVFAVPGPVAGTRCYLPNIEWDIDTSTVGNLKIHLINDFTAQAYACLLPEVSEHCRLVKTGQAVKQGAIAVIGAGTGLGHASLVFDQQRYIPVASEAGHATFSFFGEDEKNYEEFLLSKIKSSYVVNDEVVSGRGLCYLHEFLTGQTLTAAAIFSSKENTATLEIFSRFYARVCRNYCLTNMITNRLIISGGLTIKHPELIESDSFIDEFLLTASPAYDEVLLKLPVYLNSREEIGLIGAAAYAKTICEHV